VLGCRGRASRLRSPRARASPRPGSSTWPARRTRRGTSADRLQRIATETKGKYFPNVTAEKLQPVFNAIDSKLNCDVGLDGFVDALSDQDMSEPNDVVLDDDTQSADLNVSWARCASTARAGPRCGCGPARATSAAPSASIRR
jgi:hypothetical protein